MQLISRHSDELQTHLSYNMKRDSGLECFNSCYSMLVRPHDNCMNDGSILRSKVDSKAVNERSDAEIESQAFAKGWGAYVQQSQTSCETKTNGGSLSHVLSTVNIITTATPSDSILPSLSDQERLEQMTVCQDSMPDAHPFRVPSSVKGVVSTEWNLPAPKGKEDDDDDDEDDDDEEDDDDVDDAELEDEDEDDQLADDDDDVEDEDQGDEGDGEAEDGEAEDEDGEEDEDDDDEDGDEDDEEQDDNEDDEDEDEDEDEEDNEAEGGPPKKKRK